LMIAKTFSAILSAITFSAIFTIHEKNMFDNDSDYSFEFLFGMGSMVLAAFYLLAGIPLSVLADRIACRSRQRFASRAGLHFILGAGFGLLFFLVRDGFSGIGSFGIGNMIGALLLFGISGIVFAIYEYLTERIINLLKR